MKRILVAFGLLLLLSSTAVANMVSVRELRIQADTLGHWTKTYKPWGRTIDIDVPIIVPDVDSFPVLTIENAIPLTDLMMEDIIRAGEQLQDDCWFYSVENGERKGDQLFIRLTRNTNGIEKDSFLQTEKEYGFAMTVTGPNSIVYLKTTLHPIPHITAGKSIEIKHTPRITRYPLLPLKNLFAKSSMMYTPHIQKKNAPSIPLQSKLKVVSEKAITQEIFMQ